MCRESDARELNKRENPRLGVRERCPQGEGSNRQIASLDGWLPVEKMPDDKGCITEEPCAINVARTVLKQRWMERSVHRL